MPNYYNHLQFLFIKPNSSGVDPGGSLGSGDPSFQNVLILKQAFQIFDK